MVSASDVQALRRATGAGMLDAKKALEEADGDVERATRLLRERGLASAAKRVDRDNAEGAVALSLLEDRAGAIVELRCETDFVAKAQDFVNTANELAAAVATDGEQAVAKFESIIEDLRLSLKENIALGRVVHFAAGDGDVVSGYLHVQADRGVNAVLVQLHGGTAELAHDIALHIAFARPRYLSRADVPAEEVERERETFEVQARNSGKPEAALAKIVEGRLDGFFKEICLLDQAFVKDEKRKIHDVLAGASVVRFAQVEIGR